LCAAQEAGGMSSKLVQVEVFGIPIGPWFGLALFGIVVLALFISLLAIRKKK
jgi:hypothetical protein